jgi:uncharacterized protein
MKVWIDIDNPPQTRYLLPLTRSFERAGFETLVTARASETTLPILESEGAEFHRIGSSFGKGSLRKARGVVRRTRELTSFLNRRDERVDLVIAGSRPATLAAMRIGIPSFVILDYEYVNLAIYRLARTHVVYPDVISTAALAERGLGENRMMPFPGLKEDLTFAHIDLTAVEPHRFADGDRSAVRILVRPPAEESHYYRSESLQLTMALLRHLAENNVTVIFVPRYPWQVGYLDDIGAWSQAPIVVDKPLPVVALLKAVDGVVSAGGTMLREAAFLGISAYSTFRSRIGAVDRYLASTGRLSLLTSPSDFSKVRMQRRAPIAPLRKDPTMIDRVVEMMVERAHDRQSARLLPSTARWNGLSKRLRP